MKIGIYGYGNLAKGVELAVAGSPDMELAAVFTRRDPASVTTLTGKAEVVSSSEVKNWVGKIDVMIICGGSATDLPEMTPALAESFCVVDSFDNHSHIPEHYGKVDAAALKGKTTALISCGWDPGMFSLARAYSNAILPGGHDYTFWGRGVSQGHSDAIRRIEGVLDARQYTVPVEESVNRVRNGEDPELTTRQKHTRECFVVAAEGADKDEIRRQIVTMPAYFADNDTTVTFITKEELQNEHRGLPHGGSVIRTGSTGLNGEHKHTIEYQLKLDSNPEFTGSVLAAFARAVYRMNQRGQLGCKTVLDIAPIDLMPEAREEVIAHML